MKRPLQHVYDYLALCVLFSLSLISLIYFNGNPKFQIITVSLTALSYVIWGVIHHKNESSYSNKILLEYVLYGVLGAVLIIGLI